MVSPRHLTTHHFSSRDALPSLPSRSTAIACRGPGVATPSAGWALCACTGYQGTPVPGGLPPPGPPADCDWGRDGQDTPARPPIIFHREMLRSPAPSCPGQSCAGVRGCNPRAEADFSIRSTISSHQERAGSGKSSNLSRGACCPAKLRLGQRQAAHAGTPIHHFSSPDAPPPPVLACQEQSCARGPGAEPRA
jgi:hypothetical protein